MPKEESARAPARAVEQVFGLDELAEAILTLKGADELRRFLRDLCTLTELEAMAHRWQIAQLLDAGRLSYVEIADEVGGSTATVTRVAHWLRHGAGGYRLALDRLARGRKGAR
jgi:TrpR-related protein YerC/YecD